MDIAERIDLLGRGYTHEQCDAIAAAREAAKAAGGRKRRSRR